MTCPWFATASHVAAGSSTRLPILLAGGGTVASGASSERLLDCFQDFFSRCSIPSQSRALFALVLIPRHNPRSFHVPAHSSFVPRIPRSPLLSALLSFSPPPHPQRNLMFSSRPSPADRQPLRPSPVRPSLLPPDLTPPPSTPSDPTSQSSATRTSDGAADLRRDRTARKGRSGLWLFLALVVFLLVAAVRSLLGCRGGPHVAR